MSFNILNKLFSVDPFDIIIEKKAPLKRMKSIFLVSLCLRLFNIVNNLFTAAFNILNIVFISESLDIMFEKTAKINRMISIFLSHRAVDLVNFFRKLQRS